MNDKKNFLKSVLIMMMSAVLCVGLTSCGGDDSPVSTPPTVPNDGNEQTDVVSNQDPDGTVVVNMNNGSGGNYVDIGIGSSIHIDAANNFVGNSSNVEFVSVGEVSGLSKVTSIPTSGWAKSAAVVPGTGYVARCKNIMYVYGVSNGVSTYSYEYYKYARLYVVERTINTIGGIMGATVKYQSPFQMPIELNVSSLSFTSAYDIKSLTLSIPTDVTIVEKPKWCEVYMLSSTLIAVQVSENVTAEQRTGNIVLRNNVNSVTVSVIQQGSSTPSFQAGSGTADDPYQICTAKQLGAISKAPNAHFVLTADIDLDSYLDVNGNGWSPINNFGGNFDGQGFVIKGLWINRPSISPVGLFGNVSNATLRNVRIEIGNKGVVGSNRVGGLCGYSSNSVISKCSVKGTVGSIGSYVGGLCGFLNSSYINQCYTEGSVSGTGEYASGIAGYCENSSMINDCYSIATLSLSSTQNYPCYGISDGSVSVTNCYYAGTVSVISNARSFRCYGNCTYFDKSIIGAVSIWPESYGRTTKQMMTQSNYEGWNFSTVWRITEGSSYPTLRCFDN